MPNKTVTNSLIGSFSSYEKWYDKVSRKDPEKLYTKLDFSEYEDVFTKAKKAGIKNISRTIARSQRKWDYFLERSLKKEGIIFTGKESAKERGQIFLDWAASHYDDLEEARNAWEAMYR